MFLDGQCLRGPSNFTGILRIVWDGFGNYNGGDEHVDDHNDVDVENRGNDAYDFEP